MGAEASRLQVVLFFNDMCSVGLYTLMFPDLMQFAPYPPLIRGFHGSMNKEGCEVSGSIFFELNIQINIRLF